LIPDNKINTLMSLLFIKKGNVELEKNQIAKVLDEYIQATF
jgi:hypothetical protein